MNEVYEIGNGQTCNTDLHKVCGSLDCMHDQKAILIGGVMNDTQIIENHPQDSRVKLTNTVQSLTSRMGTGGVTRQW